MLKGIRFFLIAKLLCFFTSNLYAYTYTDDFQNGIFWGNFPIVMNQYAANAEEAELLSRLVQEAKEEWENLLGIGYLWSFSEVKISSNFSGSLIRWSDNFAKDTGYDASTVLAVTVRHNNGYLFQKVEIILNGGRSDLRRNQNDLLKKTIIHELGHTIGLGHSDDEGIMHPYIGSFSHPMDDDVLGALAVIDENMRRQEMMLTGDHKYQVATCGTIGDPPDDSGSRNFIYSWLAGFLMLFAASFKRVFKFLYTFEFKIQ